jgi:hypothetical protein
MEIPTGVAPCKMFRPRQRETQARASTCDHGALRRTRSRRNTEFGSFAHLPMGIDAMCSISTRSSASIVLASLIVLAQPCAADETKSATFDCDGGPSAGGFSMVGTYYLYPGRNTPAKAAVTVDGQTTELTIRSHDDATGWTFYSTTPPEIVFRWVGSTIEFYRGAKPSKCVEVGPASPVSDASTAPAQVAAPTPTPSAQPAQRDCSKMLFEWQRIRCAQEQAAAKPVTP